jgi:transcriptional regulator with XRE-family HTH domain
MELSKWVRAARTHKGLTQQQLGDKLHVTKGNVSAWENGHHEPSFGQLQIISEVTGYPLLANDVATSKGREVAPPPPAPPGDFRDRHTVTDSDWALLQDIKDAMANPVLAKRIEELRAELAGMKEFAETMYERRIQAAKRGRGGEHMGGMSGFGGLDDLPKPPKGKK